MGAVTPIYALPYPVGTDLIMDGDNAIEALARRVEALLGSALGVPTGRRNVIRNGDMGVAQRGSASVDVSGTAFRYFVDGWCTTHGGGAANVLRSSYAPAGPSAPRYALTLVNSGSAAAADYWHVGQHIEGVDTLAGQQVTLSFTASQAGIAKLGVEIEQQFATGGSPSPPVMTAIGAVALSGGATRTRYALTFTMPSIAGKVYGTAGNDYVVCRFWISAGANYAARASAIGVQNGTVDITDVQLEAGPLATPFERLSRQAQLAWCQRYYYRRSYTAVDQMVGVVSSYLQTSSYLPFPHPVPMRAAPSAGGCQSGSDFRVFSNGGTAQCTSLVWDGAQSTPDISEFNATHPACTAGGNFLRSFAASTFIHVIAEL